MSDASNPFAPDAQSRHARGRGGLLGQLWRFRHYARPHRQALFLGMALRGGELLADLIKPWPLAFVIDTVLGQAKPHGLTLTLLRLIGSSPTRLLSAAAGALL